MHRVIGFINFISPDIYPFDFYRKSHIKSKHDPVNFIQTSNSTIE